MACTLTSDPSQIDYDKGKLIVSISPTKLFPSDTVFNINVPRNWNRSLINTTRYQIINATSQLSCVSMSSNLQSNINCTISGSTQVSISMTNLFATSTNQTITFSIYPIRNPPTT